MKNFTFRQYRRSPKDDARETSGDKDNAAYLKRREQVRRAQRTHRERKENYIKSLENEVLQLRTNESKILQETHNLYTEIARLKKLLDQYGIPHGTPTGYALLAQPSDSGLDSISSISVLSNPHQQQQLHVGGQRGGSVSGGEFFLSESDGSASASTSAQKAVRKKRSFFRGRGRSESESNEDGSASGQTASALSAITASAANLNLRDMDQTNLGMEFVLTLEAPCLHHTQGDPKAPEQPTGHALTTTAPLLFQSPTQPVPTTSPTAPAWQTSNTGLEKLLSLSSNFELTDEITPVQAWAQLRSHPDFESLEVPKLRQLTEDMLKHVKCYGFGAVIDTDVFANLVAGLFPRGGFNFGFAF